MWKNIWITLTDNKKYIVNSTVIFTISIIIGYIFINKDNPFIMSSLETFIKMAEEIKANDSTLFSIVTIFKNNLLVAIFMIFLGIFFGILPIMLLVFNGLLIGFLIKIIIVDSGQTIGYILVGIIPHGIFELPAIIISAAFGIRLGVSIIRLIQGELTKNKTFNRALFLHVIKQTPTIGLIVTVMLLLAAVIESTITPFLLTKFFI